MKKIKSPQFLVYLANPYMPRDECLSVISSDGLEPKEISFPDLSQISGEIITYDLALLTNALKEHHLLLPPNLIDIEQAARLSIGKSHREYSNNFPWSIWRLLERISKNRKEIDNLRNWHWRTVTLPDRKRIIDSMRIVNKDLNSCWNGVLSELRAKNDLARFMDIEVPICRILNSRQYKGIKLDPAKLENRIDLLDDIIADCNSKMRSKWGIIDSSNLSDLRASLEYSGYGKLAEILGGRTKEFAIELTASQVEIIGVYDKLIKARRDKNVLLKFGAIGEERIFPIYEAIGTITGRILVKSPSLQQLKKSSRDIIAADKGYSLLYPDFRQFEPGILADDSGDVNLRSIYNSGDIYTALGLALFGSRDCRKVAKGLFLAYSYGMRKEKIAELVGIMVNKPVEEGYRILDEFFGQFTEIEQWKNVIYEELLTTGRIGTRNGNYRYRKSPIRKRLTDHEKRGAVSQRIQGTASLIVKRCILRIAKEISAAEFLIPMHDAVLYQVPAEEFEKMKRQIEEIFLDEFRQECQSITPKVSFSPFWEAEKEL